MSLRHRIRRHIPVFLRFAVSGGLGAMTDFGVLLTLTRLVGWEPEHALIASGTMSLLVVFTCNKYFTFREHDSSKTARQAARFLLVYGFAAVMNYILSLLFLWLGFLDVAAKALAIVILMFLNYAFLSRFVFPSSGDKRMSEQLDATEGGL